MLKFERPQCRLRLSPLGKQHVLSDLELFSAQVCEVFSTRHALQLHSCMPHHAAASHVTDIMLQLMSKLMPLLGGFLMRLFPLVLRI